MILHSLPHVSHEVAVLDANGWVVQQYVLLVGSAHRQEIAIWRGMQYQRTRPPLGEAWVVQQHVLSVGGAMQALTAYT